jgi:hypothetical protein
MNTSYSRGWFGTGKRAGFEADITVNSRRPTYVQSIKIGLVCLQFTITFTSGSTLSKNTKIIMMHNSKALRKDN